MKLVDEILSKVCPVYLIGLDKKFLVGYCEIYMFMLPCIQMYEIGFNKNNNGCSRVDVILVFTDSVANLYCVVFSFAADNSSISGGSSSSRGNNNNNNTMTNDDDNILYRRADTNS